MGTSRQPGRTRVLLWLASFVVVFGAVSWTVTGGVAFHGASSARSQTATATPRSPAPPDCLPNELEVVGAFNECATAAPDTTTQCSTYGPRLDDSLRFAGTNKVFALDIQIDGGYAGPGTYELPPWPRGLGTQDDVPRVAVFSSHAAWQSVAGVLTIGDGLSGTVNVILEASNGTAVVPGPTLSLNGPWSCP